jgi:hypothetical protein
MEDKMKFSMISLVMCFAIAPFAAHATDTTAQHYHALHQAERAQRYVIPKSATAFVPAVKVGDDSDGLSRNREDCNRGCIDN